MVELKGISIYFLRERLNIDAPRARLLTEMSMIIQNGLAVCFRVGYARAEANLCFVVTVGRVRIESRDFLALIRKQKTLLFRRAYRHLQRAHDTVDCQHNIQHEMHRY